MALVLVLIRFAVLRFLSAEAERRPPNSFIWVPLSLAMGVGGSMLISAGGILGEMYSWLHELGRLLPTSGDVHRFGRRCGGMVLPLVTRGEAPARRGRDMAGSWDARLSSCCGARAGRELLIENSASQVGGLALRAAVTLFVLLVSGRIYRVPTLPGWHRRLVWLSAWDDPRGLPARVAVPPAGQGGAPCRLHRRLRAHGPDGGTARHSGSRCSTHILVSPPGPGKCRRSVGYC